MYLLRELSGKIQDYQYILAGLECAIKESGDSELMEYFMCNKNLSVIKVCGTSVEFVSHGYADVYDSDAFEQYVRNHNGYMYSRLDSAVTRQRMEMLYRAIFSEGVYKLRMCAAYNADVKNGLTGLPDYSFPPESRTYLPNPHIQNHGCTGSYDARFLEYIHRKDYIGAIEQAAVSGRNLNFYDSAAMSSFAESLSGTTVRCIEKQDGTLMTPHEAIKELEEITHAETNNND
jgi:hypothetical protein